MKLIRCHLGWKLFVIYLILVAFSMIVLVTTAELAMPYAFERHLAAMAARLGHEATLVDDLYAQFRRALTESIAAATTVSVVMALGLSLYVSKRIVAPIRSMMLISRRVAAGHYDERVQLANSTDHPDELDELGQLALSFDRMAETLAQTENRRRELIADVTHELRTPLTGIKGYMEGLMDGVLPADNATFEKVYHEADRLQHLVHDLQELSRIEAKAYSLNLHPISPASLVRQTADRLRPQFEEKGITLSLDLPDDLPRIQADENRLAQVLVNLIGNALQYTPSGGQVCIRARRLDDAVRFDVSDTGVGIAAEHLPHLFERFYRVDNSRSRAGGGTGIGLTISQHLVQAQGGQISATSDGPNKGSTFTFTIPIA